MAGYVKQLVGEFYKGNFKLGGTAAIKKGAFVVPDYADGEFDIPAGDALGEVYFVANEISSTVPYGLDDKDFSVAGGAYVKGKPVIDKEMFVTDQATTAALAAVAGTELAVGANGLLGAIADLTAVDFTTFKTTFVIERKETLMGASALVVVAKVK